MTEGREGPSMFYVVPEENSLGVLGLVPSRVS